MKRVQEKIKDLVDVRTYETVKNFSSDTHATVAAYRFTDATAGLMAQWLDEIVELANRDAGAARALAGNRGVGKSHFLAVLAALCQHSELRTRVSDQHVGMSAQRLPRQKHFVVNVERGLGATLHEELRTALDKAFGETFPWGESAGQMLSVAASRAGRLPLVVVVDSAFDRKTRVKRDDGAILGEMAETARYNRIFLAIALDDDIAGADGVNAAIARTCQIDFLDQEHLYRIVDAFLFQKRPAARQVLRELYQGLREVAPGFNWSEPRFAALYPIHPVVVDIAPAIRLYAPKFAFLPFAAENAAKLINRPAHSLLALDEVFDRIEPELRKASELEEAFQTYDELAANAIARIPIMQRMQAKLVLKGLFLLSLDGRGATARELGAAMLIYDENFALGAIQKIEETVLSFAAFLPDNKLRRQTDNNEIRYVIGNNQSAGFEAKLGAAAQTIESAAIQKTLQRAGQARFADWTFGEPADNQSPTTGELEIRWRGTARRGRLLWLNAAATNELQNGAEDYDWQVVFGAHDSAIHQNAHQIPTVFWQAAALRPEEEETLRRFVALQIDEELSREFGETVAVAEQTTRALVERIWIRVFLENAELAAHGNALDFAAEARAAVTLAEALEQILTPIFDDLFPAHPDFGGALTETEVSQTVSNLFAAANVAAPHTQQLAVNFAAPLNLVALRGNVLVLETDEQLLNNLLIKRILERIEAAHNRKATFGELAPILKAAPLGLNLAAQQLLLAALVARRRLEFVTATNARITHRSLDLQINWSEIVGVAQTSVQPRAASELANWANLLLGVNLAATLDEQREQVFGKLENWLAEWRSKRILERFDELPDEVLNVRAWRASALVARSFGAVAEALEAVASREISLEEGLERVIDAFGNQPANLGESRRLWIELETFVATANLRRTAWQYASRAENTADAKIEILRQQLHAQISSAENAFDQQAAASLERIWLEFQELYAADYLARHNHAREFSAAQTDFEMLAQNAEWKEFMSLATLPFLPVHFIETVERLTKQIKTAKCQFDAAKTLQTQPICACGFRLNETNDHERALLELQQAVAQGRHAFRRTIAVLAAPLAAALNDIAARESNREFADRARLLGEILAKNQELPVLSALDVRLLEQAAAQMQIPIVRVRSPRNIAAQSLPDLRARFNQWFDNLPNAPVLVKILEE